MYVLIFQAGYGRTLLSLARGYELEFPLTVGRDFSGVIIDKGHSVNEFQVGDRVYGFVPLQKQGSHAEAVVVHKADVSFYFCFLVYKCWLQMASMFCSCVICPFDSADMFLATSLS